MIPEAVLRAALAEIPKVAIFVFDAAGIHVFTGGDPRLLADLNLPADAIEGMPVGFSVASSSTWSAAVEGANAARIDRVSTTLKIRFLDRHYEVHSRPLPEGHAANILVDVTPRTVPPGWI